MKDEFFYRDNGVTRPLTSADWYDMEYLRKQRIILVVKIGLCVVGIIGLTILGAVL